MTTNTHTVPAAAAHGVSPIARLAASWRAEADRHAVAVAGSETDTDDAMMAELDARDGRFAVLEREITTASPAGIADVRAILALSRAAVEADEGARAIRLLDAATAALTRPVSPEVRGRIEEHVERMIALLDEIDGDPDAEPYLATTAGEDAYGHHVAGDDREEACDDEGAFEVDGWLAPVSLLDRHAV